MKKQNLSVLVASEYPGTRRLLRELSEPDDGTTVVGEAKNVAEALSLANCLKPDIAVIDFNLPRTSGVDNMPLSRASGLDVAQTIGATLSDTMVVLINDLDAKSLYETPGSDYIPQLYSEKVAGKSRFTLQSLRQMITPGNMPVFANIELNRRPNSEQKLGSSYGADSWVGRLAFFGALSILGGGLLFATLILAPAGAFLFLTGATAILIALASKIAIRLPAKVRQLWSSVQGGLVR